MLTKKEILEFDSIGASKTSLINLIKHVKRLFIKNGSDLSYFLDCKYQNKSKRELQEIYDNIYKTLNVENLNSNGDFKGAFKW